MSGGILRITDGTTSIDLLNCGAGITLTAWTPSRPAKRRVKTTGPFGGGARVRMYAHESVVDGFTFIIHHDTPNLLIHECQEIDRLLLKAIDYWASDWMITPVWLEARGEYETNTRYAVITDYEGFADSNPYSEPFTHAGNASMGEVTLAVEHLIWQDVVPGAAQQGTLRGTITPIEAMQVYNATTYGRDDTGTASLPVLSPGEWYVGSKANMANITHAYWRDESGGGWSTNRIGAALPQNLFPNPIEDTDKLYLGCQTAVADSGPFCNIVFDLETVAVIVGGAHFHFEYYNGAWVPLTVYDNTNMFRFTGGGVCSIHWRQPADWTAVAINGVTAYWIRIMAQIGGGESISVPTQQHRWIYTCTWPGVTIEDHNVGGDLPALAQLRVFARSDSTANAIEGTTNRVILGLRSLDRGADFVPYINFGGGGGNDQNNADVTVDVAGAGACAFQADTTTPCGMSIAYTPGAGPVAMRDEFYVQLGSMISSQYIGKFRAYMRYNRPAGGGASDLQARLAIYCGADGAYPFYTDVQNLYASTRWTVADFGVITLPPRGAGIYHEFLTDIFIQIEETVAAARTATFYDLILMPVDEWFGDFQENITAATVTALPLSWPYSVTLDSVTDPKHPPIVATMAIGDNLSYGPRPAYNMLPYTAGPIILQANKDQKYWFFLQHCQPSTALPHYAPPHLSCSVELFRAQRYSSMRGTR